MSEQSTPATTTTTPEPENRSRIKDFLLGTDFQGYVVRMVAIPIIIYLLIFLFGFFRAWVDPDGSAAFFEYLRGLIDMVVSVTIITIFISIGVLIIQIARFVNLLRSEVKPITEDAKQAAKNVRATTAFIQKNAIAPVIKIQSILAGIIAVLREIVQISKMLQNRVDEETSENES